MYSIEKIKENLFSFSGVDCEKSNIVGLSKEFSRFVESEEFYEVHKARKLSTIRKSFIVINLEKKEFSFIESAHSLTGNFVILCERIWAVVLIPQDEIKECELTGEKCHISQLMEVKEDDESEETFLVKKALSHDELFCPECGTFLLSSSDIVKTSDGTIFCSSDCAIKNGYEHCANCGEWEQDSIYVEDDGESYCYSCFNRIFVYCHYCDTPVRREGAIQANDGTYFCNSECVANSDYYRCADCGELFHADELSYSEYHEEYYCEDCYPEEPSYRDRLVGYRHEKPTTFLHTEKDEKGSRLYLGAENELEFSNPSDMEEAINKLIDFSGKNGDLFVLKEDGSLNEYGMELVTLPITLNWYKIPENAEKFKHIFEVLNYHEAEASSRCGMHVHLSRAGITEEHEIKLEMFFQLHRDELFKIAGRKESGYAKFCYFREISDKEAFKAKNCRDSRYRCLNWQNERTVEIRIFAAVTEYADYMKNVEFSHCVYQYTKYTDLDTIEKADFSHFLEFAKNADNYPHFVDFIEENFN